MNCAWGSKTINCTPLSRLDDGCNDILMMTEEGGAGFCALTKVMILQDDGDYFE